MKKFLRLLPVLFFLFVAALSTTGFAQATISKFDLTKQVKNTLPYTNGGSGTAGLLTGFVRGGNPFTASEISGDCGTSGSNVITCTKSNGTLFGTGAFAAIANYVLATTTVNGHALSSNVTVTASDISLGSVTNDAQTKQAVMPNTVPSAGQIPCGNAGGTAYAPCTVSGDSTITSTGVTTNQKINGIAVAGTPAIGYVPTATGPTAATWQAVSPVNLPAAGTSATLSGPSEMFVCSSTCTVTPPLPAAGYQFCIFNGDNIATVITLAAIGTSARYENTARTAYGTAGTGTFVSGGAVKDSVCIVGLDGTHYITTNSNGTWTAN